MQQHTAAEMRLTCALYHEGRFNNGFGCTAVWSFADSKCVRRVLYRVFPETNYDRVIGQLLGRGLLIIILLWVRDTTWSAKRTAASLGMYMWSVPVELGCVCGGYTTAEHSRAWWCETYCTVERWQPPERSECWRQFVLRGSWWP
jgi:hypothetical protein